MALHKALSPMMNTVGVSLERDFGPDALGYKDPENKLGDDGYKGPEEHRRTFNLRYDWNHNVALPVVKSLLNIEESPGAPILSIALLCAHLGQEKFGKDYTLSEFPEDAADAIRSSARDVLKILKGYQDVDPEEQELIEMVHPDIDAGLQALEAGGAERLEF